MLIAVDSTVYSLFQSDFGGNLDANSSMNYIKVFLCQMVNSVSIYFK